MGEYYIAHTNHIIPVGNIRKQENKRTRKQGSEEANHDAHGKLLLLQREEKFTVRTNVLIEALSLCIQ